MPGTWQLSPLEDGKTAKSSSLQIQEKFQTEKLAKQYVGMGFFNNASPNMASILSELHYLIEYSMIAFWN